MAKAEVLHDIGRLEEAREALTNALVLNPTYDEAWTFRGRVSLELGDPEEARRCYEEALHSYEVALEVEPGNAEVLRLRAKLLEDLARDEEALPAYALAAKAGDAPAMAALARLRVRGPPRAWAGPPGGGPPRGRRRRGRRRDRGGRPARRRVPGPGPRPRGGAAVRGGAREPRRRPRPRPGRRGSLARARGDRP